MDHSTTLKEQTKNCLGQGKFESYLSQGQAGIQDFCEPCTSHTQRKPWVMSDSTVEQTKETLYTVTCILLNFTKREEKMLQIIPIPTHFS